MTSLASTPPVLELRAVDARERSALGGGRFRLLPTSDGWSLVGPDGAVAFRGLGARARRECLEFARAHGVLAVFS